MHCLIVSVNANWQIIEKLMKKANETTSDIVWAVKTNKKKGVWKNKTKKSSRIFCHWIRYDVLHKRMRNFYCSLFVVYRFILILCSICSIVCFFIFYPFALCFFFVIFFFSTRTHTHFPFVNFECVYQPHKVTFLYMNLFNCIWME